MSLIFVISGSLGSSRFSKPNEPEKVHSFSQNSKANGAPKCQVAFYECSWDVLGGQDIVTMRVLAYL